VAVGTRRFEGMPGLGRCTGLCSLVLLLACSVYDSALIDAGVAGLPARPAASTSSVDDRESLLFALNEIFLRQSAEMAARVGIDLDSTMTTGPSDATCVPPTVDGEVVGQAVVDGDKGVDNAIGSLLLPAVGTALPCLEDNLALTQGRGIGTVLVWVRDWNGLDNDASVSVVLTNAVDATSEVPSLVGFAESDPVNLVYLGDRQGVEAPPPRWNGQDYWYLDPADFDTGESGQPSLDLPKDPQLDAYVSYGRLVVLLRPGTAFELIAGDGSLPSDGDMTIAVNGGYLLGDIDEGRTGLARGLFAGRLTLEKLAQITPKVGLCAFDAELMQTLIGQFADIVGFPEDDSTGIECDAFSVGVTFKAVVGQVAGLAASSRSELEPCANTGPAQPDRCCPSEWMSGKSRAETCDTFEKVIKAARFDSLSPAIVVPVPEPELF